MSESDKPIDRVFATITAYKTAADAFDIAYDVEESANEARRAAARRALDSASVAVMRRGNRSRMTRRQRSRDLRRCSPTLPPSPTSPNGLLMQAITSMPCASFTRSAAQCAPRPDCRSRAHRVGLSSHSSAGIDRCAGPARSSVRRSSFCPAGGRGTSCCSRCCSNTKKTKLSVVRMFV
jgi:hypothetical protein